MPDKPKAQKDAEKRQQESMPDSNKTSTKTKPEAGKAESDDSGGETSDRTTKQFEKLKRHNKELADKVRQLQGEQSGTVFDMPGTSRSKKQNDLAKKSQQVAQDYSHLDSKGVQGELEDIVDENGLVDVQLLNKTLKDANKRAKRAETQAKKVVRNVRKMEENQQLQDAYKKYPQLNPRDEEFDESFFNIVRDSMVGHMARGERDLLKVASNVANHYNFSDKKEKKNKALEKKKKEAERKNNQARQINATGTKATGGIRKSDVSALGDEELVKAVQHNEKGALAEMLRRHEQQNA